MGLVTGLVPPRVDAHVKAGLLALVEHATTEGGWPQRQVSAVLGLDHVRVLRVLTDAGMTLPQRPARARRERRGLPDWAELVPGVIWIYDI